MAEKPMISRRSLILGGALFCAAPNVARSAVEPVPMQPRPAAPPLVLRDMAGASRDVFKDQAQAGHPPIVLAFWATWCAPCRRELPSLVRLREGMGESDVLIYAVNFGEAREKIPPFLDEIGLSDGAMRDITLLDPLKSSMTPWRVGYLPLSYLIAPNGKIAFQIAGEVDWLDPTVAQLLTELRAESI